MQYSYTDEEVSIASFTGKILLGFSDVSQIQIKEIFYLVCFRCTCIYPVVLKSSLSVSSVAYSKTGDILYKAQSQDEDALVHAAAQLHMLFVNKNANILGKSQLPLPVIEITLWIVMVMIQFTLNILQRSGSMRQQFNMKFWKLLSSLLKGKECQ
jgi:hypothetical protein